MFCAGITALLRRGDTHRLHTRTTEAQCHHRCSQLVTSVYLELPQSPQLSLSFTVVSVDILSTVIFARGFTLVQVLQMYLAYFLFMLTAITDVNKRARKLDKALNSVSMYDTGETWAFDTQIVALFDTFKLLSHCFNKHCGQEMST
jgi:hypothetical protein